MTQRSQPSDGRAGREVPSAGGGGAAGADDPIVGRSVAIREVIAQAERLASVPRPVLIRGERGTGKELIAARLHTAGSRAGGPFVCVNCGAITDELLSAELFGHEKGAFTGADQARSGKLEQADGGTLFLDEVANMSPRFQEHVLRVIEYQQFTRVRGCEPVHVDVRVLAATNADLEGMIAADAFRSDLYDRLSFATIDVPPLRHRREDIPLLVRHFEQAFLRELPNLAWQGFDPAAMAELEAYYWPGNIRQLRNLVERMMILDRDGYVTVEELPPEITAVSAPGETFTERVAAYEQQLLLSALKSHGYRMTEAAASLGLTYDQFRYYVKKYDLRRGTGPTGQMDGNSRENHRSEGADAGPS